MLTWSGPIRRLSVIGNAVDRRVRLEDLKSLEDRWMCDLGTDLGHQGLNEILCYSFGQSWMSDLMMCVELYSDAPFGVIFLTLF